VTQTSNPLVPSKAETVAHRRIELKFARALGIGTGTFLIFWGPLSLSRWLGVGPAWSHIEGVFDVIFGVLLVLPYARVSSLKIWRRLMILLTVMSVLFVFVLVFDVLYVANLYVENADPSAPPASAEKSLYVYDDDTGPKLPFPVLNCALVFLALMQAPVVFFSRYPEKLD
jgi:hypothetical protein